MALAARKKEEPPPPPPAPAESAPAAAPAPPPAPALFPTSLPIALQTSPGGLASLSAQTCNGCHGSIHEAWSRSAHAHAWSDPLYQKAMDRVGRSTACLGCHLPLANQHPRLAAGYVGGDLTRPELQPNPAWEPSLMVEGVTCAACHVRGDTVLGLHAAENSPHPVAVSQELQSPEMCATCHQLSWPGAEQPLYDTYGEWKASAWSQAGVRCQDCHMPATPGAASATRFAAVGDHAAGADLQRALTLLLSLPSPEIQRGAEVIVGLRIQNTGAGHAVPTGSPFKSLRLQAELLGADGKALAPAWSRDFARKVEEAPPWRILSDNRLGAGQQVDLQFSLLVDQKKSAQPATLALTMHELRADQLSPPVARWNFPLTVY